MNCDFCAELSFQAETRFGSIYAGLLDSRVVLKDEAFAALPTIGQLFEGSFLVIPTTHNERYADLLPAQRSKALQFVTSVERRLRSSGPTMIYEHGARSINGGGCGVYHAHVHVVPLPRHASVDELLLGVEGTCLSRVLDAWDEAAGASEYLLVRDTRGQVMLASQSSAGGPLGSQFMRRRLVELFQLQVPWDWREYRLPEPKLLRACEFRSLSGPHDGMDH